jgi:hypothetical protein
MKRYALLVCLLFLSAFAWSTVNVTMSSPATSTVSSPLTVKASATSDRVVTGWRIYLDNQDVYNAGTTTAIAATLNAAPGAHTLIVRAWDSSGAYGSAYANVTVSAPSTSGAGPVPPSTAVVYSKIEERPTSNWFSCRSRDCSGSDAFATYWVAPYQTTPSLDGASTQFYVSGNAWADVLWVAKLGGAASSKTHFILDYWLKPNADTLTHAECLEFDVVMAYNGRKWDFSHQLHYGGGHFDTWDGVAMKWVHTNMALPKLDPNTWHHIKLYGERVGTQTHNISLTVDSNTYQVPTQYAWHETKTSNWANSVAVQVQIDINSKPGTASEYVDNMNLYLW